ncbi:MAG: DUF4832 domain-containing protein [Bacteroidales bacterium]|nr:DUF4832 domain-containing protein [Bacteroidales bacterium]
MKRLLALSALAVVFLLTGCKPDNPEPGPGPKPAELADPELSIDGAPGSALASGASFNLRITSKSDGAVTVSIDKPSVAAAEKVGDLEYKFYTATPKDETVKIVVSQEKTSEYKEATAEVSVKVTGSGSASLPGPDDEIAGTAVEFEEASGEVLSPERGLYTAYECHGNSQPISGADVKSKRLGGHTLWLIEFYLKDFMNGSISSAYLKKIQQCFDAIREGGCKAIVRFAYRVDQSTSELDQEPEVDIVMKHIEQVKPILQKNEDVLFVLQAGFIGTWGEWYYTTHFSSMANRKKVTDALLDAVPVSRQIELRTPAFKKKMYGLAVKDTITAATAHDGSIASRLAGHNDCFGASENDQGTFDGEGDRTFWKADTRYTIMGGETCALSDYCLCPNTLKDLVDYHWTYLHDGYNRDVLARWQKDGCFDEIKSRLGYRLVLKDVHYDAIEAGKSCTVTIRLENKGFAAPMNPREAWLVWVTPDGKEERTMLGADPRTWHSGYNAVVASFTPSTAKGSLYLDLPDPLLSDNPSYSIALANKQVFDSKTGLNKLFDVK